jgi:hypothetical protein
MLMKSTAQRCGRMTWILTAFTPVLGVRLAAFNPWAYMQIAEGCDGFLGQRRQAECLTHSIVMTGVEYFCKLRTQG